MNRAALTALLFSAACTSTATSPIAKLANPTAVAQVGRFMLVLDEDRSQARALSLGSSRSFERAPDPIYALAIPSAPYPNAIASYTPYTHNSDGNPVTGDPLPFSFMLSTSSSQVTVFRSPRPTAEATGTDLARLGEFQVPDTTLAVAVQPCAESSKCSEETTNLVLAAAEPTGGAALYATSLPSSFTADGLESIKLTRIVDLGANSRPQALAFSPSNRNLVAVADQNTGDDGLGRAGSLALVELSADLTGGTVTRYSVGGPLRSLSIDPTGTRLFGLIDSAACGAGPRCSGVIGFQLKASDLTPDAPALTQVPFPGAAPIPVPAKSNEGAARGIASSAADTPIAVTPGSGPQVSVNPLVMVSLANGAVALVDGQKMLPMDNEEIAPATAAVSYHLDSAGTPVTIASASDIPTNLSGTKGATQTETVTLTNGGALPSLSQRSGVFDPTARTLSASDLDASDLDFPALGVLVGDRVRFVSGCPSGASGVAGVAAVAKGVLTLASSEGCPATEAAAVTFDVTAPAPGADPAADVYVVAGSTSGLMGRVHPNEPFTFPGASFSSASSEPALTFTMGSGDHGDGASYGLSLFSGFSTLEVSLTSTSLALTMPGSIAFDPQLRLFYVAYQGGGALVELDPTAIRAGSTTSGIAVYR